MDNINNSEIAKPINNFPDIKELKKKKKELRENERHQELSERKTI